MKESGWERRIGGMLGIRNALAWVLVEANSILVAPFIRGHKRLHRVVQVVQCRILCAT